MLIAGLGVCLVYIPSILAVGFYFEKRRALANGIAMCGSGIGTFVFAPLCRILEETYSWKGSTMIIAGLALQCVLAGAVFRPLYMTSVRYPDMEEEEEEHCSASTTSIGDEPADGKLASLCTDDAVSVHVPLMSRDVQRLLMEETGIRQKPKIVFPKSASHDELLAFPRGVIVNDNGSNTRNYPQEYLVPVAVPNGTRKYECLSKSHTNISSPPTSNRLFSSMTNCIQSSHLEQDRPHLSAKQREVLQKPLFRKDIFYSGSIYNLPEFRENPDVHSFVRSMISVPSSEDEEGDSNAGDTNVIGKCISKGGVLRHILDLSLFKDPIFVCCCLSSVLWTGKCQFLYTFGIFKYGKIYSMNLLILHR